MKAAVPLAENILAPLAAASAIDAGIKKKNKKTRIWDNNFNNFQ